MIKPRFSNGRKRASNVIVYAFTGTGTAQYNPGLSAGDNLKKMKCGVDYTVEVRPANHIEQQIRITNGRGSLWGELVMGWTKGDYEVEYKGRIRTFKYAFNRGGQSYYHSETIKDEKDRQKDKYRDIGFILPKTYLDELVIQQERYLWIAWQKQNHPRPEVRPRI
ncbi:hypothetical protein CMO93_01470 [Candidatus Woesearchaeota archaeon]|nr:hypothetical protein [Candidatus Woesearchaeota archaeon]|tara:strand:+ start:1165 stop:1659 length:495 start_codon:yes stop_codon:yes gene_type:complete